MENTRDSARHEISDDPQETLSGAPDPDEDDLDDLDGISH